MNTELKTRTTHTFIKDYPIPFYIFIYIIYEGLSKATVKWFLSMLYVVFENQILFVKNEKKWNKYKNKGTFAGFPMNAQ